MKKLLAIVMAGAMIFSLTGVASAASRSPLAGEYEITVWVADAIADLTAKQIQDFNETNPDGIVFKATVEKVGENVSSVNLPCYMYGSYVFGGDPLIGDGLVINVYADRVEFLGRNFVVGGWIDFTETVPLSGISE